MQHHLQYVYVYALLRPSSCAVIILDPLPAWPFPLYSSERTDHNPSHVSFATAIHL